MAEVSRFKASDAAGIRDPWNDPDLFQLLPANYEELLEGGPAFSLVDGDRVIGCGGVIVLWPGCGHAWLILSTSIQHHAVSLAKACIRLFPEIAGELDLSRLQATVDARDHRAIRFVEWMGLRRECLMRKYGPGGTDHYLYSLVKED